MAPNGPFSQSWWWFSIIYSDLFIYFFYLPANTAASFRVSKHHSNKRQLELQPANTNIKNKARFGVLVIFSLVWRVFAERRCDCAVSLQSCRCAFRTTQKDQVYIRIVHLRITDTNTYSSSWAQPLVDCLRCRGGEKEKEKGCQLYAMGYMCP